ncbi:MAG: hypothetical protein RL381_861 [Actinomycetota bacterium]|jgi:uncharacterized protein YoxC
MGPGGIATIIAAISLLVIAIALAYTVIRVSRFIDEAKASLKAFTDDTTPLINESTRTLELINSPLESFAKITKSVEEVTTKVTGATSGFMEKNGPAVRVAGALLSAAQISKGRKSKKKSS